MTEPRTMRAEQLVVMAARRAKARRISGPVVVWLQYWRRTKRRCDWDNLSKLTCDALNGIVWEDDSQVVEAHVTVGYDKDRPRTEVRVESAKNMATAVDWNQFWEAPAEDLRVGG